MGGLTRRGSRNTQRDEKDCVGFSYRAKWNGGSCAVKKERDNASLVFFSAPQTCTRRGARCIYMRRSCLAPRSKVFCNVIFSTWPPRVHLCHSPSFVMIRRLMHEEREGTVTVGDVETRVSPPKSTHPDILYDNIVYIYTSDGKPSHDTSHHRASCQGDPLVGACARRCTCWFLRCASDAKIRDPRRGSKVCDSMPTRLGATSAAYRAEPDAARCETRTRHGPKSREAGCDEPIIDGWTYYPKNKEAEVGREAAGALAPRASRTTHATQTRGRFFCYDPSFFVPAPSDFLILEV